MGHSLSADKRERQNLKRRARNRYNAVALKKSMKTFTAAVAEGKADKKTLDSAFKALDIAARKNTIPKKRADRKKGRLAAQIHKAAQAAKK
jgi:small subunit ribosomal protein S20